MRTSPGPGSGVRPLPLLHDLRGAVTGDDDFAHARVLLGLRIIRSGFAAFAPTGRSQCFGVGEREYTGRRNDDNHYGNPECADSRGRRSRVGPRRPAADCEAAGAGGRREGARRGQGPLPGAGGGLHRERPDQERDAGAAGLASGRHASASQAAGSVLVPGLIDAHAWAAPTADLEADYFYLMGLAHGVTGFRVINPRTGWGVAQRDRVDSGEILAPRLWTSGRGINQGASPDRWLFDATDAAAAVGEVTAPDRREGELDRRLRHRCRRTSTGRWSPLRGAPACASAAVLARVP